MNVLGKVLSDRYEIIEKIGTGGMSNVYTANDRKLNRIVAIKVLKDELKSDEVFVDKFKVEAQSAAGLSHNNIVSVYDVGEDNGIYYFVMEYVKGMPLQDYLKEKGPLDYKSATDLVIQIAMAIEHAHSKSIVHCDIKPHNMLMTTDGTLKVTDFGIARAVSNATIVRTNNIIGSVHYFSPEQAEGKNADLRSDIYSMGVVYYELLTGRLPFTGDSPFAIAKKHITEMPMPPSAINNSIPPIIDSIVLKLLKKDPFDRYINATALLEDLRQIDISKPESIEMYQTQKVKPITTVFKPIKKEEVKEEKSKAGVVVAWILSLIILAGAFLGAAYMFYPSLFAFSGKGVPNLVGQNLETVQKKYQDSKDITITVESEQYSKEYEEGKIISQSPEAGSTFDVKPTEIKVVVSKGVLKITLEDYSKRDYNEIKQMLEDAGVTVNITTEKNDQIPKDAVIKTVPDVGSTVKSGDEVNLFVSSGPENVVVTVPDLVGKTESEARRLIIDANLVIGEIIREQSSTVEKDKIISQSPRGGREVNEKTVVDLVISSGKTSQTTTYMPNVIGLSEAEARAKIEQVGLECVIIKQPSEGSKGKVLSQNINANSKVTVGSKVTIVVGK